MAVIDIPSNGTPVQVVAAGGRSIVQVVRGSVLLDDNVDPSAGIIMQHGAVLSIDGWAAAFYAKTHVAGQPATIRTVSQ